MGNGQIHYIVELLFFALLAYLVGCVIGWLLRRLFGAEPRQAESASAGQTAAVTGVAAGTAAVAGTAAWTASTPAEAAPSAAAKLGETSPVPAATGRAYRVSEFEPSATSGANPPAASRYSPPPPVSLLGKSRTAARSTSAEVATEAKAPVASSAKSDRAAAPVGRMQRPRGASAPRGGKPDDLKAIVGIGPKNEKILHSLGFYHFDQIASWTPEQVAWVEDHLQFDGRIEREEWVRQAKELAGSGAVKSDAPKQRLAAVDLPEEKRPPAKAKKPARKTTGAGRMTRPRGISAARAGKPDNLQMLSGVGPKNEKVLHNLGFFHFDQIAAWTSQEIEWVDDHLKFNGRIQREEWVRQAKLLADGKLDEFKRQYGTGGLKNKQGETVSGSRTRRS